MIGKLDFVVLDVADIAALRSFYTDTLGFAVEGEAPAFLQFAAPDGAVHFAMQQTPGATHHGGVELWWLVTDPDAEYERLARAGVQTVSEPHDMPFGRVFEIRDPAGNVLRFYHPAQRS